MRGEDLTKGWLLALLEQAPLEQAPRILAADLTRDGPRVCDAVVRAVADDTDLRRLEVGGALEPLVSRVGELAGAQRPEDVSGAVDCLHAVIWSALREELRSAEVDQVSEIVERLVVVIGLVRGAALRRVSDQGAGATVSTGRFGHVRTTTPRPAPAAAGAGPHPGHAPTGEECSGSRPFLEPSRMPPEAVGPPQALWVGALHEEIQHSERSGSPLSLLLAELDDAHRVAAVETPDDATTTFGHFAQAVRGVARRQDILVCETDTRAWIIARDTGRAGARALGARIAGAVREAPPWRGVPMAGSVGVAVLGEDGRSPGELIEAAEEARFAATASGVGIVAEGSSEPPSEPGPRLVS